MTPTALAIMPVRNERDILPWTVQHLQAQGIGVYAIDNWSTDGSWEMLPSLGLTGFERFPVEGPDSIYQCRAMLDHIDELAAASDADWCMFNDADEIRRSNRPGETLAEGLQRVQSEGFNVINFRLFYFPPTDNSYSGNPESHFRYHLPSHSDCRLNHPKAWRNLHQRVNLSSHGSHALSFEGMRVYPERWILKHYPIRSQSHGEAKMQDRLPRFDPAEKARGWHVQYRGIEGAGTNFLRDPSSLVLWA